jgi:Fe-S-cluster-containing dehydrogenase component
MPKILKPTQPEKCIGCEMCVFEAQRQLKKIGMEESLVRVFRKKSEGKQNVEFELEIDPRINILDIEKISSICPRKVFEVLIEQGLVDDKDQKHENRFRNTES